MIARLLAIAEHLEWAEYRGGSTQRRHEQAMYFKSCPSCGGVKPKEFDLADVFPASARDHAATCELAKDLADLRQFAVLVKESPTSFYEALEQDKELERLRLRAQERVHRE